MTAPTTERGSAGESGTAATERPAHAVNVTSANPYRYSTGGQFGHAMYERRRTEDGAGDYYWQRRAELPHVHARIVRRDGSQRRVGTAYLISANRDDATRVIVTDDDLADGSWAVKIGANLSADRHIITAAGTAIRDLAHRTAAEREATPRPDVHTASGHVDLPVRECLPTGYLSTPPVADELEIRAQLREVVSIAAQHPKLALTMGASAGSPYVGPLRRQSHWWDLYGEQRKGKSTGLAIAAMLWGDPRIGTGIMLGWDTSRIGIGRQLGQLGILPPFLDERGLSRFDRAEWGEIIYSTCQGSSRLTAEVKGDGVRRGAPWFGVLFSTGNARLTDGIAAGRFAGVPARVIELSTPFTSSAVDADRLAKDLAPAAYGWLGAHILATVSVPTVRELIAQAAVAVGYPAGGVPRTISEHLHLAVAGAAMIDAVLGTGTMLTDAATVAAIEHLTERGHDPEHDADRMLSALGESLVSRRGAWPTEAEYIELGRPRPEMLAGGGMDRSRPELAQHGYDRELFGVISGGRLFVFPSTWRAIAESLGVDSSLALAELHRRNLLHVATQTRKRGEWTDRPRIGGVKAPGLYNIGMTAFDEPAEPPAELEAIGDEDQDVPAAEPAAPVQLELPAADDLIDDPAPCGGGVAGQGCGFETDHHIGGVAWHRECWTRAVEVAELARVAPELPPVVEVEPAAPVVEPIAAEPAAPELPAQRTPRGASPASTGRAARRAERLAADLVRLAEGEPLRLLSALETTHAPMRRHDSKMHAPYWRPELPGMIGSAHVVSGWHWSREFAGDVSVLDRSGAWVAAASSVAVAHGALEHTGEVEFTNRPGYYLMQVHPWYEAETLPHPLGHVSGDTAWVPAPTVSRLVELAAAGRWADATVLDSYTGEPVRLTDWVEYVNRLRTNAIRTYGRDSDQYAAVKEGFGQATSLMLGTDTPGSGRKWKCKAMRPDWTHSIQAQASATLHRWADDCAAMAPEHPPVSVRNVDELWLPAAALEIVTTQLRPGGRPPMVIDPDGIKLGSFKVKGAQS